ncbi:unnamed protein product [Paramecium primaurelia]|uniref:nucleoside-diphosphate kinase n=4 Tax=Paramecium TaxID=5884 RepID=A0BID7_PARTE|nr:uncharacterized protein GSPATT00004676001 [Paramecium tetraurelia]CAD8048351.1 unnamed protein product [Paramecium primaurelia]CAD8142050.1 unnamed protein product [Paramecium pentaurelia]CAD8144905.1 unnamed protein product [Paramecium octaurelia]CAD8144802.1 unnamed protein product [Paramecium pentaurelia]CAK58304.1 unnamed protein product [Paramecium tetraurelia]|eukprot:XP_001425702.1 hypothetical protein (macronuclear) [Paramecium tetraurelia strain d4-2]
MEKEQTFVLIKPDGVQRRIIGRIIQRFEDKGFSMVAMKMLIPNQELLQKHYEELMFKPFFPCLICYMLSGPVIAMIWQGKDVVRQIRSMLGEGRNPIEQKPGTIRADYALELQRNLIHGSDSCESAQKEINLWFNQKEIVDWKPSDLNWVCE